MYKSNRKEFKHNNNNYNSNLIITILWYIENSSIVRTVYWGIFSKPWKNTYLKPKAFSKSCQTCKMIMHSHSQNVLFKHFQRYLGILRDIDVYSVTFRGTHLGGEGRPPLPFLEIKKSVLILERKVLIVFILGFNLI